MARDFNYYYNMFSSALTESIEIKYTYLDKLYIAFVNEAIKDNSSNSELLIILSAYEKVKENK